MLSSNDFLNIYNAINPGNTTATYVMERAEQDVQITNLCNAVIHVVSYLCVARRDVPAAASDPGTILFAGFTANGYAGAGNDTDSTPFMSANFVDYFRIVTTKRSMLDPGQAKSIRGVFRGPRRINTQVIQAANVSMVGGLSRFWLHHVHGTAAVDLTAANTLGISPCKVGFITRERYTYRFSLPTTSKYTNIDNLNNMTNGTVLINDDTGAAEEYKQAGT